MRSDQEVRSPRRDMVERKKRPLISGFGDKYVGVPNELFSVNLLPEQFAVNALLD